MQPEDILKELYEIRVARSRSFVPYDQDRELKRRDKELWNIVSRWYMATFEPEAWKAHQEREAKEQARIASMNKARKKKMA